MDDDDYGYYTRKYDMDVHYWGVVPDPGRELEEEDLGDYIDTHDVDVYDWKTVPYGDGMVKLTIEGRMHDRLSLEDVDDAIIDDRMEGEITEYEYEDEWSD